MMYICCNGITMRQFLLWLVVLAFYGTATAQHTRRCGMDEILLQDFRNNSTLTSMYREQLNSNVNAMFAYDTSIAQSDTVYTVQVVVHVVYLKDNKYENIPDDIIQSQIDALNRDFNALNEDSVNLRSMFFPFRGNAKIKFELAKRAPNGAVTTGITRTKGSLGSLTGWDPISTILWTALGIEPLKEDFFLLTGSTGKSPWPSKKYLNIYVCDLNYANRKCASCLTLCDTCGALGGFAYPPSNAINWGPLALDRGKNDGIVIDFRFFGQNNWYARDSTSQRFRDFYTKGRTTVHEVGHYFGLQHTWGNVLPLPGFDDGCAIDDFMDDTPEEEQAFASNLVPGTVNPCDTSINTCNKPYLGIDYPDMFENYMDYSSDMCYSLFTKQQVNLMRYNLIMRRGEIISAKEVPATPTAIQPSRMKEAGISFYPNPAKNSVWLQMEKPMQKDMTVQLLDISGKVVATQIVNAGSTHTTVSVEKLAAGSYLLKCFNDDFVTADQLIKQ